MNIKITATGLDLPKDIYSNQDIIDLIYKYSSDKTALPNLEASWIEDKIGIKERRFYPLDGVSLVNGAFSAASEALAKSSTNPGDLDFVLFSSVTNAADHMFPIPSIACQIQEKLKAYGAFAFDLQAACSGFLYALHTAISYIESGLSNKGMIICGESSLPGLNFKDYSSSILIGDVNVAVILEKSTPEDESKILSSRLFANLDAKDPDIIRLRYNPLKLPQTDQEMYFVFSLDGKNVYKRGVNQMYQLATELQNLHGESDHWIFHQANKHMLDYVASLAKISPDKNLMNIRTLGNTIGATIPSVLHQNIVNGKIKRGDQIAMVAFGGGITSGRICLTY